MMRFISFLNLLFFVRYLNFCPDIFDREGKWPYKKAKTNLKIYDVTT